MDEQIKEEIAEPKEYFRERKDSAALPRKWAIRGTGAQKKIDHEF